MVTCFGRKCVDDEKNSILIDWLPKFSLKQIFWKRFWFNWLQSISSRWELMLLFWKPLNAGSVVLPMPNSQFSRRTQPRFVLANRKRFESEQTFDNVNRRESKLFDSNSSSRTIQKSRMHNSQAPSNHPSYLHKRKLNQLPTDRWVKSKSGYCSLAAILRLVANTPEHLTPHYPVSSKGLPNMIIILGWSY